ncbi:MAG: ATP-binding cassette domain-containing protein [Acidimicrobiales bacterium]
MPSSGSFHLAGEDVSSLGEDQLAEVRNRHIGFVFQQFNLLPFLTAWRNVELPLVYAGLERAERRARALDALEQVGLADRADHRPGGSPVVSSNVAVARALVTEPALILADEPTGFNLDSASTHDVLDLFQELNRRARTVVLITHEPDVAAQAAARSDPRRAGVVG